MIEEYRLSLKMPEVEEIFDLIFYRPLAFLFVQSIKRFSITPNQITFISMMFGFFAAWQFSHGTSEALIIGGALFVVSNVLDCADGQLARIQKSGSLLGRVIDGVADYIVGLAVFISIGFGFAAINHEMWILVILAGFSTAMHAIFFDHYQNEFMSTVRSEINFLDKEIEQFSSEVERMRIEKSNSTKIIFLILYLKYLNIQKQFGKRSDNIGYAPDQYKKENSVLIRFWSFIGPTTNRTILIFFAFLGRIDIYLWVILIAGNLWLIFCRVYQYSIDNKKKTSSVNA
ncbi:MAG: CDP-alcohol phosphatidyltransferase family protein [Ignavibacteriales bacterium]|nr:CDP-alcohol phosphatidyltransferase family protein [Ignavibacteriales bacterium]